MVIQKQRRGPTQTVIGDVSLFVVVAIAIIIPGWAALAQTGSEPASGTQQENAYYSHMSEELRASIKKVIVVAGESPPYEGITGDYDKETLGLLGGMDAGSEAVTISKEIAGVPISIGHPILTIPAAIS